MWILGSLDDYITLSDLRNLTPNIEAFNNDYIKNIHDDALIAYILYIIEESCSLSSVFYYEDFADVALINKFDYECQIVRKVPVRGYFIDRFNSVFQAKYFGIDRDGGLVVDNFEPFSLYIDIYDTYEIMPYDSNKPKIKNCMTNYLVYLNTAQLSDSEIRFNRKELSSWFPKLFHDEYDFKKKHTSAHISNEVTALKKINSSLRTKINNLETQLKQAQSNPPDDDKELTGLEKINTERKLMMQTGQSLARYLWGMDVDTQI